MIDPRGVEVMDWCNQMVQNLAPVMNAPRLLRPEDWEHWAMSVCSNPTIRQSQPPDPRGYSDWRVWAERFIQTVSL